MTAIEGVSFWSPGGGRTDEGLLEDGEEEVGLGASGRPALAPALEGGGCYGMRIPNPPPPKSSDERTDPLAGGEACRGKGHPRPDKRSDDRVVEDEPPAVGESVGWSWFGWRPFMGR